MTDAEYRAAICAAADQRSLRFLDADLARSFSDSVGGWIVHRVDFTDEGERLTHIVWWKPV